MRLHLRRIAGIGNYGTRVFFRTENKLYSIRTKCQNESTTLSRPALILPKIFLERQFDPNSIEITAEMARIECYGPVWRFRVFVSVRMHHLSMLGNILMSYEASGGRCTGFTINNLVFFCFSTVRLCEKI